ncbi:MAG: amidohydrolase family protein [Clostridiaceae bacterium]|nr:amidohydrolase family protein [Clostridiaceae bacterium]
MDIIDVNTMLGPYPTKTRYRDAAGLVSYLDDYRITSAVTYHGAAQMTPWQYNAEMTQIANQSGGRIRACHVLDPMLGEKNEPGDGSLIERLRQNRPEAVRLLPVTQSYPINSFFCDQILEPLNELHLPLLLDASEIHSIADIPPLAQAYPDLPIVILRHYFNHSRTITPLLTKLNNVYIDMNIMIDTGYLEELVEERCGSEKLLLGSGLPIHVPAGGLSLILYSTITAPDKENILHANWERLQRGIRYDHQR